MDDYFNSSVEFVLCMSSGDYIVKIPRDNLLLTTKIVVNSENGEVALCIRKNTHVCDECKSELAEVLQYYYK